MDAHVLVRSYDTYGGHSSISIIGDLIEHATRHFDCGVATFDATLCFRTNRPPKPTLEELQSQFHAELEGLPHVRWERKKRRLSVRYESRLGLAEQILETGPLSRVLLQSAVGELATVLKATEERLSGKPGFNVGSFLAVIDSLSHLVPMTDEGVVAFRDAHAESRRAERSLLPWWEQLEIDWAGYHPTARDLLNDPFFWREADDYSPHGNDTGADLMNDFRAWRPSHRRSPPMDFLQVTLHQWGVSTDWKSLSLEEWDSDVELAMHTHDQAAVALAFALIKLEGSCDNAVHIAALEAIGRQGDPRVAVHFGWEVSKERAETLGKLRKALEREGPI